MYTLLFAAFQENKMIDLVLWHSTIGCFYLKFKCYVGYSAFEKGTYVAHSIE